MTLSKQLSGRKILVVEDEWLIAEHLSMLLDELECEVIGPVATVAEALAKVEAEKSTVRCSMPISMGPVARQSSMRSLSMPCHSSSSPDMAGWNCRATQ